MFPPAAAAGAGGGAWQLQQGMGVRTVAAAHVVLGLATAAFALYAVVLNPADLQPQTDAALRTANCDATPEQELACASRRWSCSSPGAAESGHRGAA
ncbi:hypothetical protein D1007_40721 [Hordeum vulgare]|nr:hypothetical protein D1007_40721 [Hordeum vulgare]